LLVERIGIRLDLSIRRIGDPRLRGGSRSIEFQARGVQDEASVVHVAVVDQLPVLLVSRVDRVLQVCELCLGVGGNGQFKVLPHLLSLGQRRPRRFPGG
jgi:hypothetical protein